MPDEDNNFGGTFSFDFRQWWRHVQPAKNSLSTIEIDRFHMTSPLSKIRN